MMAILISFYLKAKPNVCTGMQKQQTYNQWNTLDLKCYYPKNSNHSMFGVHDHEIKRSRTSAHLAWLALWWHYFAAD
jgi:hypothetical protein